MVLSTPRYSSLIIQLITLAEEAGLQSRVKLASVCRSIANWCIWARLAGYTVALCGSTQLVLA